MASARPLSFPLHTPWDLDALAAEAAPALWRRALLLTAEPASASAGVVAVAERLGHLVAAGRETVTLGRLLVMVRSEVVAPAGHGWRARRRRLPVAVRPVLPGTDGLGFLAAQVPVARHAVVLWAEERLPAPDVAAVVGLPPPGVERLLDEAERTWAACLPALPPLRRLARVPVPPPPPGLGRAVREALSVAPLYVTDVAWC